MDKKILISTLGAMLAISVMAGCGKKEETTSVSVEEVTVISSSVDTSTSSMSIIDPEAARWDHAPIGVKTETAVAMIINNKTGQDITSFKVVSSTDTEEASNMMTTGDTFKKDDTRILYYEKSAADQNTTVTDTTASTETTTDTPDAKTLEPEYTITFDMADGTTGTVHAIPLDDTDELTINVNKTDDQTVYYLTYISTLTGQEISTLDAETAIMEQEKKAQEDAQATQTQQDTGNASNQTQSDNGSYNSYDYSSDDYSDSSESYDSGSDSSASYDSGSDTSESYDSGSDSSGSNDGCVGDDALYY